MILDVTVPFFLLAIFFGLLLNWPLVLLYGAYHLVVPRRLR